MRQRATDAYIDVATGQRPVTAEVDDAIVLSATRQLAGAPRGRSGDQDTFRAAHHALAVGAILCVNGGLQAPKPRLRRRVGHLIREFRGGRSRTRAVYEAERAVELDVVDEPHRLLEVPVALPWEADDEIRRQRQLRASSAQPPHDRLVLECGIAALHRSEH